MVTNEKQARANLVKLQLTDPVAYQKMYDIIYSRMEEEIQRQFNEQNKITNKTK